MKSFLVLSIALCFSRAAVDHTCYSFGPRVDCGIVGTTEEQCRASGCCWAPTTDFEDAPPIDLPWCFKSNNLASYSSPSKISKKSGSFDTTLQLDVSSLPELGTDLRTLKATASEVAPGIVRFRLTDNTQQRWEVPPSLYPEESLAGSGTGYYYYHDDDDDMDAQADDSAIKIEMDEDPFAFRVFQNSSSSSTVLWNSTDLRLVFKEQYIELSTWMDSSVTLYGAGTRASSTLHLIRNGVPRALWNQDVGPTFREHNSYGSHPFILALSSSGESWGFFLLSSNGMDIVPAPDRVSWRIIGGMVDIFVLTGPTPTAVLDQFTRVVGRPAMMPMWSLGWHQSKYGYQSVWEVEAVVKNYSDADIPLEAIWTDIDHMDRWTDFTFDPVNYPVEEMQRFVRNLTAKGQYWVPIVDPGIKIQKGYAPYEMGLKQDVFIKGAKGEPYLSWVWPGATHYPDFFSNAGREFFAYFMKIHHDVVPWSGIWIDMNEPSNFCTASPAILEKAESEQVVTVQGDSCELKLKDNSDEAPTTTSTTTTTTDPPPPWVCQLDCSHDLRPELNATMAALLDPPYAISNSLCRRPLGVKGTSVLATHLNGTLLHYNAHNVYSLAACRSVHTAVKSITGKRPFVLTRSSFSGVGAVAATWSGDNSATWADLALSIPAVLSYGLFGMPFGGVDICGFGQDTSEELCARWTALGAIGYPFARNHADLHSAPQEPYLWPATVAVTSRTTLRMRYKLLSYYYTALRVAHAAGTPIARPLWINYPHDTSTHRDMERGMEMDTAHHHQFMVGDALLVIPVLQEHVRSVKDAYFPASGTVWYPMFEDGGASVVDAREAAQVLEIPAPLESIPLYVAGGKILPLHTFDDDDDDDHHHTSSHSRRRSSGAGTAPPLTTAAVRKSPLSLVVALKHPVKHLNTLSTDVSFQNATGFMYFDDGGASTEPVGTSPCNFLNFALHVEQLQNHHHHQTVHFNAVLDVTFGVPEGLSGYGASHYDSASSSSSCSGFEWPRLLSVKVLGWHLPILNSCEILMEINSSSRQNNSVVVQSVQKGGSLSFTILENGMNLEYSSTIRFKWMSEMDVDYEVAEQR